MMWRCVNLVHSFLPLVFLSTFWSVVYGQSDTNGPCNTCPVECIGRQCPRYWWTSMWGFIVTLVVLTMDVWGATKAEDESRIGSVFLTFFGSALNPLLVLWSMFGNTMNGMTMLVNLREVLGDNLIAPLYPWSKSHIKIILGSSIIVNLSPNNYNEMQSLSYTFDDKVDVEDLSEALVIGHKVANSKEFNVQLALHGHLALMRANVLPPYDELKFLRGNSSLGTAVASAQAIGYIYGIVVCCVQGLRVSPIEAIACMLNMVILMKGVFYNFTNLDHRPLLLYLLPIEEAKFIEECKNVQGFKFRAGGKFKLGIMIACGFLLAMGAYFIANLKSSNRTCIVPIIFFEVTLILGGILGFWMENDSCSGFFFWCLTFPLVLLNVVGYVWALVVTFKYWKGEEFDVRSSNYLSQVLPYIG